MLGTLIVAVCSGWLCARDGRVLGMAVCSGWLGRLKYQMRRAPKLARCLLSTML